MITISSEKNLLSKVLAMILLFILPSNLYRTPIPHKLGLFCRNLAFLTCDWQYLVWRRFVLLLPCPKKSDKMWTLSESVVQKESFPSARCLRQKAERGRAGVKRGGEGRGSSYRRRRIGAHPASAPSAAWERGCVALLVRLRRGFVIFKSFRLWSPLRLLSVYVVVPYQPPFLFKETSATCFKIVLHDHTYKIIHGGSNACLVGKLKNRTKRIWRS